MVARNDITGDKIQSKENSKAYADNFDKIFGKKKKEIDVPFDEERIDVIGQNGNKDSKEFLANTGYIHPDDKKNYKRNVKACRVLLEYYTGKDDE
jgi:hypothetical protein